MCIRGKPEMSSIEGDGCEKSGVFSAGKGDEGWCLGVGEVEGKYEV